MKIWENSQSNDIIERFSVTLNHLQPQHYVLILVNGAPSVLYFKSGRRSSRTVSVFGRVAKTTTHQVELQTICGWITTERYADIGLREGWVCEWITGAIIWNGIDRKVNIILDFGQPVRSTRLGMETHSGWCGPGQIFELLLLLLLLLREMRGPCCPDRPVNGTECERIIMSLKRLSTAKTVTLKRR